MTRRQRLFSVLAMVMVLSVPFSLLWASSPLTPEVLEKTIAQRMGQVVNVEGKYKLTWGGAYIVLVGSNLKYDLSKGTALQKMAADNKDSKGKPLTRESSNVLLIGKVYTRNNQNRVLLSDIKKLPDDQERFELQLAEALKVNDSPMTIHKVTKKALVWSKKYKNKELKEWSQKQDRRALEMRAKVLKDADVDGWLKLASEYLSRIDDRIRAIELLGKLHLKITDKIDKKRVGQALEEMDAFFYKGQWVPIREYYKKENYVQHKDLNDKTVWVSKNRAEFLDFVKKDRQRKVPFMSRNRALLKKSVLKGKVEVGMHPIDISELHTGKNSSLGYPHYTDRLAIKVGGKQRVYDQWVYRNKRRFYFVDGLLLEWKDK